MRKTITRFRRSFGVWRRRYLPIIGWVATAGLIGILGTQQTQQINAIGMITINEVLVVTQVDGTINELAVELFDTVEAGQLVALINNDLLTAELRVAHAELARLRANLEAEKHRLKLAYSETKIDQLNDQRRLLLNEEEAKLDYLDRVVEQETHKVNLKELEVIIARRKRLVEKQAYPVALYEDTLLQLQALETQLRENESSLKLAQERVLAAADRKVSWDDKIIEQDGESLLKPLEKSINLQQSRIEAIMEQQNLYTLNAPVTGQVTKILRNIGENIMSGEPILSISSSDNNTALAYLDPGIMDKVKVGDNIQLCSRRYPKEVVELEVLKIGSQVEELPPQLQRNPTMTEWGLPIMVGEVPMSTFYPGEIVDLVVYLN